MGKIFIGIDLGATNIKIGCFDSELKLIGKTSIPAWADMGPEECVENIAEAVEKLLDDNGLSPESLEGIGLQSGQIGVHAGGGFRVMVGGREGRGNCSLAQ